MVISDQGGVVIILDAFQLKVMHVSLKEIKGTDVVENSHSLSMVLVKTKNDILGLIRK